MRVHFHLCAFLFICARLFSFMGSWLHLCTFVSVWWCDVGELVEARGCSWCRHVVADGVVVMGHCGHLFVVVHCHLLLWVM